MVNLGASTNWILQSVGRHLGHCIQSATRNNGKGRRILRCLQSSRYGAKPGPRGQHSGISPGAVQTGSASALRAPLSVAKLAVGSFGGGQLAGSESSGCEHCCPHDLEFMHLPDVEPLFGIPIRNRLSCCSSEVISSRSSASCSPPKAECSDNRSLGLSLAQ